jgi:hypothetical protein
MRTAIESCVIPAVADRIAAIQNIAVQFSFAFDVPVDNSIGAG